MEIEVFDYPRTQIYGIKPTPRYSVSVKLYSMGAILKVSKFQFPKIKLTLFIYICPYYLLSNHRQKTHFSFHCTTKLKIYFRLHKFFNKIPSTSLPGIVFDTYECVVFSAITLLPTSSCRVSFSIPMRAVGIPHMCQVSFSIPMRTVVFSAIILLPTSSCRVSFSIPMRAVGIPHMCQVSFSIPMRTVVFSAITLLPTSPYRVSKTIPFYL